MSSCQLLLMEMSGSTAVPTAVSMTEIAGARDTSRIPSGLKLKVVDCLWSGRGMLICGSVRV